MSTNFPADAEDELISVYLRSAANAVMPSDPAISQKGENNNGKMEKISKEEIINSIGGLSLKDDELENVSGGSTGADCALKCDRMSGQTKAHCLNECFYTSSDY